MLNPFRRVEPRARDRRTTVSAIAIAVIAGVVGGSGPGHTVSQVFYPTWTVAGSSRAYDGTITFADSAFPAATFTSDGNQASVISGATSWIPSGTPWGSVFGSSQGRQYLNVGPNSTTIPSTTTYEFRTPAPAGAWGFSLGDVDGAKLLEIRATTIGGAPLTAAQLGLQGTFNYCDANPRSTACSGQNAPFDVPLASQAGNSARLAGGGLNSTGASGWFMPTVPVTSVTFTYSRVSGPTIYQTWFAAKTAEVAGTVATPTGTIFPQVRVTLVDPFGNEVAATTSDATGRYSFGKVPRATGYTVAATPPAGYTSDPVAADPTGGDVTANITLNRRTATLTLVKHVDPDLAGDPDDWTLTATPADTDAPVVSNQGGTPTPTAVWSGVDYTLAEDPDPGEDFTAGDWVCRPTRSPNAEPVNDDDTITLNEDDDVTCTITNTRNTAKLTLVKRVEGGAAMVGDWTLTATGPSNGVTGSTGNTAVSGRTVNTGTYSLSETGPGNYTASDWVCVGSQESTATSVTVAKDDDVTCTITNTRNTAEVKLVKQVTGAAKPNDWTLTAKAAAPDAGKNIATPGGSGTFEQVYAGTEYTLTETGPGGYSASEWKCMNAAGAQVNTGDKVTPGKGAKVTCTIVNTQDLGSLTISKVFDPKKSTFDGRFPIDYTCVAAGQSITSGSVKLAAGNKTTIDGLPTGTVCTVTEANLPKPPAGWTFATPTYSPANGQVTVAGKGQQVQVAVTNTIRRIPRQVCPIDVTLNKPIPTKQGNRILIKKTKTKKSACVLRTPIVICKPLGANATGEKAFCQTKVTKRGRVGVQVQGYPAVRITLIVRTKPKPGFRELWKPNTCRKSWILRR